MVYSSRIYVGKTYVSTPRNAWPALSYLYIYRQKFRTLSKSSTIEFAHKKARLFNRWCTSKNVENNHDRLCELILIEEFKNCLSNDVRTFVNDQKPKTLSDAASLADNFSLTHKFSTTAGNRSNPSFSLRNNNLGAFDNKRLPPPRHLQGRYPGNDFGPFNNKPRNETSESYRRQPPFKPIVCDYCKQRGHTKSECYSFKLNKPPPKPTGFISASKNKPKFHCPDERQQPQILDFDNKPYIHNTENELEVKRSTDPTMDTFKPFIFDGSVSLSNNQSNVYIPIKMLRDTGASQSLILTKTLPFSESSYSGKNVLIRSVNSTDYCSIPLHNLKLQSDLVTGDVSLGIIESLPFDGIHLILGNDLAGDKVKANPILTNKQCLSQQIYILHVRLLGP